MKSILFSLLLSCLLLVSCKSDKPKTSNKKPKTEKATKKPNSKTNTTKASTPTKNLKPKNKTYWANLQTELGINDTKLASVKQLNRKFSKQKEDLTSKNLSKSDLKRESKIIDNRMQRQLTKFLSDTQITKFNNFNKGYK